MNGAIVAGNTLPSLLTYRKGAEWVSQLDWMIASPPVFELILNFDIDQNPHCRTDHAALTLLLKFNNSSNLEERSTLLGQEIVVRERRIEKRYLPGAVNWSNFNSVFGEPSAALLTTSNPSQIIGEFSNPRIKTPTCVLVSSIDNEIACRRQREYSK